MHGKVKSVEFSKCEGEYNLANLKGTDANGK